MQDVPWVCGGERNCPNLRSLGENTKFKELNLDPNSFKIRITIMGKAILSH